jgi:hypothetical protein
MFKIWVVEDNPTLKDSIADMLFYMFGPQLEGTISWDVIGTAKDAIGWIIAAKREELPNVAIIDVALEEEAEESKAPELVGSDPDTRGFLVASTLQFYSEANSRIVLYTGNEAVRTFRDKFLLLPEGLKARGIRPLLKIEQKSERSAEKQIQEWISHELRPFSEGAMKKRGRCGDEAREIQAAILELQDFAAKEQALSAQLDPVRRQAVKIRDAYLNTPETDQFEQNCFLDVSLINQSLDARPDDCIDGLRLAFKRSRGWPLDDWTRSVAPLAYDLATEIARTYRLYYREAERELRELQGRSWYDELRVVAPVEFGHIDWFARRFGSPKHTITDCHEALKTVMSLLDLVDHSASLARAFLTLRPGKNDGERRRPTTVFAHACHGWVHSGDWPREGLYPAHDDSDLKQRYLAEEVGALGDGGFRRLHLPEPSLRRIVRHGQTLDPERPLHAFAEDWSRRHPECPRKEWELDPAQFFTDQGWRVKECWEDTEIDQRPSAVLLDWKYLFKCPPYTVLATAPHSSADDDASVMERVVRCDGFHEPRIILTWCGAGSKLNITLAYDLVVDDPIDATLEGVKGSLTSALQGFRCWGALEAISTSRKDGCVYRSTFHIRPKKHSAARHGKCEITLTVRTYHDRVLGWEGESA